MKTIITNSQISKFFEKTGINLGITFEIVKEFHECVLSTIYLCYKMNKRGSPSKEDLILPHSTFKKIVSFTKIKEDSDVDIDYLHLKVEKRMIAFLRFAKNKIINGKLIAAWRQYLHAKMSNYTHIKIPKINTLWFIIDSTKPRSRTKSQGSGSVRIVSQDGGGTVKKHSNLFIDNIDTIDLEEFDKILTDIGLISKQESENKQNFDEYYIKWAANQIKERSA